LLPDLPDGGATLFLIGEDRACYGITKRTWQYLPDTAVSLKMGDFNTPPVNPIFQKENGGLKLIFQNHRQFSFTQDRH